MRRTPPPVAAYLLALAIASIAYSRGPVAIPPQEAASYHVDFRRHFFSSPAAERADRAKLQEAYEKLDRYRGALADSADNLLQGLQLYEQATISYFRHENYLFLRASINTEDADSASADEKLIAEFDARTAFVRQDLQKIDDETLDRFIEQRPALAAYRFAISDSRRFQEHELPLSQEELLARVSPFTTGWQKELYEHLIANTRFGTVATPDGALEVRRQQRAIYDSPLARVRKEGFERLYAGFEAHRDLYAFTIEKLAQARNQQATLHGFTDDAERSYFASYWTKAEVGALLSSLAHAAETYRDYERERARRAVQTKGVEEANFWDVSGSLNDAGSHDFTIVQATEEILAAVAPLGEEFHEEMSALLDPRNGRLDIVPGDHRKSGGFSLGSVGVDSVFYTAGFEGSYNDVRVMTHEATHAVHRQLMTDNGVSPVYAAGPSYLFESFAAFSELLLADHLYRAAAGEPEGCFYLEQFLQGKGTVMFVAGAEAALEQAIYQAEADGRRLDADALDAMTLDAFSRYSIWPEKNPALKARWMTIPLMYEDPFYDVNYVFAGILALVYYDLYEQGAEEFVPSYAAFMRNGFDEKPDVLLREFLGVDLSDSESVVDHAMEVLRQRVDQYKAYCR